MELWHSSSNGNFYLHKDVARADPPPTSATVPASAATGASASVAGVTLTIKGDLVTPAEIVTTAASPGAGTAASAEAADEYLDIVFESYDYWHSG